MVDSPFANYSVLFLEESQALQGLFEKWLSGVQTLFASSVDDLYRQLDSTVAVAYLSESSLGDAATEVRKHILSLNPHCQLGLIVPRSGFLTVEADNYDACLQRPIFKEELQESVEERLTCGVYSLLLHEFYHLNAELVGIEREASPITTTDVDPDQLRDRLQLLKKQLTYLESGIDDEELMSLVRSKDLHKRYLREPARDTTEKKTSKFHPKRCPKCKLSWGINHGNELQSGFDRVAAHVWKCRQCNNIVHGLGESHRRVTNH